MWLVEKPQISLIAASAPIVLGSLAPAVQDGFVLALVVGTPKRECIRGLYDIE
jgi:hypothetical protein